MTLPIAAAAALVIAAACLRAGLRIRRGRRAELRRRDARFVLRVRPDPSGADGDGWTRIGDGGAESGEVVSVAATLIDDDDARLRLEPGVRLRLEAFAGARRRRDDPGAGRLSLEVDADARFWILGAPAAAEIEPDASGVRAIGTPSGGGPLILTTADPPTESDWVLRLRRVVWPAVLAPLAVAAAWLGRDASWVPAVLWGGLGLAGIRSAFRVLEALSIPPAGPADEAAPLDRPVIPARFSAPVWTIGLGGAERWLLDRPGPSAGPLVLFDFADPGGAADFAGRGVRVLSAAAVLADAVRLHTDLDVVVCVPTLVGRRRAPVARSIDPVDRSRWVRDHVPGAVALVLGRALGDLDRDGYEIALVDPVRGEPSTDRLRGPIPALAESFVERLADLGWARRATPPEGFRMPGGPGVKGSGLWGYHWSTWVLQQSDLSHPRRGLVPPVEPGELRRLYHVVEAMPALAPDVGQAFWFRAAAAVRAHEANELPDDARERFLDDLAEAGRKDGLLFRLSPLLLWKLDRREEAVARREVLLAEADGPYRAWLERIETAG